MRANTVRKARVSWSARTGSRAWIAARCAMRDGPPSMALAVRAMLSIMAAGPSVQPTRQPG